MVHRGAAPTAPTTPPLLNPREPNIFVLPLTSSEYAVSGVLLILILPCSSVLPSSPIRKTRPETSLATLSPSKNSAITPLTSVMPYCVTLSAVDPPLLLISTCSVNMTT